MKPYKICTALLGLIFFPRVLDCLPQRIDCDSLMLAIYMAAEAGNPYFRLGYNSLGADSSIHSNDHVVIACMLLIPRVLDCLPQRIDCDSLMLAIYMAADTIEAVYIYIHKNNELFVLWIVQRIFSIPETIEATDSCL
ncbi:hypothetical protein OIU76_028400 [Salix suchowensis]|uniref:GDPGP1-like N-terminal domain-containing protein n=1 Tax=Salix suchowensis TaxID=1278906 RepID=A0ABQ9B329_9ROSI|nr:hypothetical protein OIU76_028400 [Salix suchowensis]KAJ6371511.1 hypothetical protein OIU77_001923 [Salix suchowensis]